MSAILSDCGLYRWRLDRFIGGGGAVYGICGVNPSTADAETNDATIRKDIGFCSRWGATRFVKMNVFGYRATDVRQLARVDDPYGSELDFYNDRIIAECDILIPCWGNRSKVPQHLRGAMVRMKERMRDSGKPVMTFGFTKSGDPMHPLMLGYDTILKAIYP
jgi:hypothetical protein